MLPVQGAANPTANWTLASQINGGGYTTRMSLTSAGAVTFGSTATFPTWEPISGLTGFGITYATASPTGNGFTSTAATKKWTLGITASFVELTSDNYIGWQNSTTLSSGNSVDLLLRRSAAANLAFGAADAASPVAQTLSVQNVVAGTSNTAGVDWTFDFSRGTGTGAGGNGIFRGAPAGTSGTSQNALSEAFRINNYGGGRPKSVTFSNLPGSPTNGDFIYCSDCAPTSAFVDQTCASGGSGSMAMRINGTWKCYN